MVGSHAHRLQGDGRLGNGYVAYGLGNYAWYSPGDAATSRTGVLHLTVRPRSNGRRPPSVVRAAWTPQRIGADGLAAAGHTAGRRRLPRRPRVAPRVLGARTLIGQRGASHSTRSRPVRSSWAGDTTDGTSLASW